jgi:hypothetical protein
MQVDCLADVVEGVVEGVAPRKATGQIGDGDSVMGAVVGV